MLFFILLDLNLISSSFLCTVFESGAGKDVLKHNKLSIVECLCTFINLVFESFTRSFGNAISLKCSHKYISVRIQTNLFVFDRCNRISKKGKKHKPSRIKKQKTHHKSSVKYYHAITLTSFEELFRKFLFQIEL